MHFAIPIHDRCLPSSINLHHAAVAYQAWAEAYIARNQEQTDRFVAAGVVLARQPYVDPPHPADPPEWMLEPETECYLDAEPDPEIFGWGRIDEEAPAADVDDEVEIADEDEPCTRYLDGEEAA